MRDWLHVIRLPAHVHDLNPTEQVWSHLNRGIDSLAGRSVDHLQPDGRDRLKRLQYRTDTSVHTSYSPAASRVLRNVGRRLCAMRSSARYRPNVVGSPAAWYTARSAVSSATARR